MLPRKNGCVPLASHRNLGEKTFVLARCRVTFVSSMGKSSGSASACVKPERYKSLRYFLRSKNVVSAENCYTGRVRNWQNLVTPGCSSDAPLIRQADHTVSTDTWDGVRQETLTNTGTRFSRFLSNRSLIRRRLLAESRYSIQALSGRLNGRSWYKLTYRPSPGKCTSRSVYFAPGSCR